MIRGARILGAIAILAAGCVKPPEPEEDIPRAVLGIVDPKTGQPRVHVEVTMPVAEGKVAEPGKVVQIHYTGRFLNGNEFDSSLYEMKPLTFTLGSDPPAVIRGLEMGVVGMKVGERRTLTIPPELAYGRKGYGKIIPPKSVLVFEVTLLDVF